MRKELRVAGSGGQGVITIARLIGRAAVLHDKRNAVLTEDYGPEKTGGWSRADVVIDAEEIGYPIVENPDVLIALSQDGFERFMDTPKPDALVFIEKDLVRSEGHGDRPAQRVPAIEIARELGNKLAANMVMLGAVVEITRLVSPEAARRALMETTPAARRAMNEAAFDRGIALGKSLAPAATGGKR